MKILHELSWLWETLGIALVAAAVCMACAALIGKAAKKKLDKKVLAVVGAAAFVGAILASQVSQSSPQQPISWFVFFIISSVNSNLFGRFYYPFIKKFHLFIRMKPMLSIFHNRKC